MCHENRRRKLLCSALAGVFVPVLAQSRRPPGAERMLGPGDALPSVSMSGLNGPDRVLSSYAGRPLIVNVWASWCGPCRAEAASLERLAWSEAGQRFTIIGVSTDDYVSKAKGWLKQSNATLSHFIDHNLVLEHLLGASQIPTTVLFDDKGTFVERFYGAQEWDSPEAVKQIESAFKLPRRSGRRRAA